MTCFLTLQVSYIELIIIKPLKWILFILIHTTRYKSNFTTLNKKQQQAYKIKSPNIIFYRNFILHIHVYNLCSHKPFRIIVSFCIDFFTFIFHVKYAILHYKQYPISDIDRRIMNVCELLNLQTTGIFLRNFPKSIIF